VAQHLTTVEQELPVIVRLERLWRAVMLAPSIEVCGASLRGESVPLDRLDKEWAERFGRRPR